MNAGKFPTAYYVVRQILQELKYNSSLTIGLQEVSRTREPEEIINSVKRSIHVLIPGSDSRLEADSFDSPSATKLDKESGLVTLDMDTSSSQTESDSTIFYGLKRNGVFVDKKVDKEKSLCGVEEFSRNYVIVDESILNLRTEESSSRNSESEEGSQSSFLVVSDKSKDNGTQSHRLMDECDGSLHCDLECPETNLKEMASEDFLIYDELNPDDKQKSRILEIHEWESHKVPVSAAEPENKSSMWQNLKSFAKGVLGMWRRS